MPSNQSLILILGNQLFPPEHLAAYRGSPVFMAEDPGLCTHVYHHQQKLVLILSAMRAYAQELRNAGFEVCYRELEPHSEQSFEQRLREHAHELNVRRLIHFEIENKGIERRILDLAAQERWDRTELSSAMFVTSREDFKQLSGSEKNLRMASFYQRQRKRLNVLLDDQGKPVGGQWSFDAENRRKLPKSVDPPAVTFAKPSAGVGEVIDLVSTHFAGHPGDAREFWWPVTRGDARAWLQEFLHWRFAQFGPYEDAISQRTHTVFHSLLSPALNLGLLTPEECLREALDFAAENDVPLPSLEGFVRQLIGWREFIRGVYREHSAGQAAGNFWQAGREMTDAWRTASTGIPPLDDAISQATRYGWSHHIIRLMVLGNLMTLAEIRPASAHRWFMEMYVDSSAWVMGPNVYGMGLFSDGGLFATKPYICGSNYLLKMSDYKRGEWCDTVDGLYWRFVDKHRKFFQSNPRLSFTTRTLDRLDPERKARIFDAAEEFLAQHTVL